ncbi:Lysosome membrane protein 2 [Saguinus oedipus]|uniref:Lysosome membrane protein 2 n=1 Tax=Saguinus oedipus TaxID=9490 RepID=A0ABQ9W674_SAGOE|nr:Lysosome membrane protein 2 [Saguinus oedipus]
MNIVLRNGTEAFDSWEKPPLPVYTQFYFFNVTNPEEILRGETPRVEEVGPYTYRLLNNSLLTDSCVVNHYYSQWWEFRDKNRSSCIGGSSLLPLDKTEHSSSYCSSVFSQLSQLTLSVYPALYLEIASFSQLSGKCTQSQGLGFSACAFGWLPLLSLFSMVTLGLQYSFHVDMFITRLAWICDGLLKRKEEHPVLMRRLGIKELRNKANIQFGDNGTTISAVSNKAYVFERDQSVGDPKFDLIRTLNIPVLTVIEWSQVHFLREIIEAMLKAYQQKLFVTHTVDELLWGYKDEILSLIHVFRPDISPYFGLFYEESLLLRDIMQRFPRGPVGPRGFGPSAKSLDWWVTDKCNMINGTDGDSFHPLITKDEVLYVFPSDFCRSVYITFSDYESVQGLPAFRYKVPAEILANTSDNAGFCIPEGNCLGSGVLNVSICKNGAPIIMSFPHFYQADERFVSAIEGMHPNKEDHETFVDINPLTGIILKAAKRFQINVYVKKSDDFIETGDIRTMVFPVMYLNESVLIDKETASRLKSVINTTLIITNIPYIIMALGVFFGLVFTWEQQMKEHPSFEPKHRLCLVKEPCELS